MKVNAIDLFCGAGGLTHGFEKVGIDVKLGIDNDPACEYPYNKNNKAQFLLADIESVSSEVLLKKLKGKGYSLLAGCAPCQTFSTYNAKAKSSDSRWTLLTHFSRMIREIEPDFVTMENVPGLEKHGVFHEFLSDLGRLQYHVTYQVVNANNYGVPQHRNRLVLLASKHGIIQLLPPAKSKKQTVRQAIGNLPLLKAGDKDSQDLLHLANNLSPLNYERMVASKPGGTWRDWSDDLVAPCHKKESAPRAPCSG